MRFIALFFLFIMPVFATPCGMQGSIEERIKECSLSKGNFQLIARTPEGVETYKDIKSGLIWGPRVNYEFNQYGSQKACSTEVQISKILEDLKWRLPTIKEFEEAATHEIKTDLPNMNHWFWTSTPVKGPKRKSRRRRSAPPSSFMWDGLEQVSGTGSLIDVASIRCVAKE